MADGVFNIAKGRTVELYNRVENNDPAGAAFVIVLLTAAEAEDALDNHDDLAALLAAGGNTEAAFTGYARKVLTDAELAALPAPDDVNNRFEVDFPDQTFNPTTIESVVKAIVCYDADTAAGTDADIIPCTFYDCVVSTDNDFTLVFHANGFFRAA